MKKNKRQNDNPIGLSILILLSAHFVFLEWGGEQHSFLFEIEWQLIKEALEKPAQLLHPLILITLAGEILLIISLFKSSGRILRWLGIFHLAVLILLIAMVGIYASNLKIVCSTLPFVTLAIYVIIRDVKKRGKKMS